MESYRQEHRLTSPFARGRQTGITVIGFLILACLVGVVGLAAIKVTPMYINNMRLSKTLTDVQGELNGTGANPQSIRNALDKHFIVEDIDLPMDSIKIAQSSHGYTLRIQYENRAPYAADLYLVVAFDKQVEIRR
jgi:Domain of unknown function (DUF4845)